MHHDNHLYYLPADDSRSGQNATLHRLFTDAMANGYAIALDLMLKLEGWRRSHKDRIFLVLACTRM